MAIRHPPSAIRRPQSAIRRPPPAVRRPPSAIRRPPSAIRHPPSAIRHPPSAIRRPPSAVRRQTIFRSRKSGLVACGIAIFFPSKSPIEPPERLNFRFVIVPDFEMSVRFG